MAKFELQKVWVVERYVEEEIDFNGHVFDAEGYLLMPNGMLYSLNPKDDNSELIPLHKDSIVFESLEELFEKFPKAVTWSYLNEL